MTSVNVAARLSAAEFLKYSAMWQNPAYAENSPGARHVDMFWDMARPSRGQRLIDVGAGSGAAAVMLRDRGLSVSALDITSEGWRIDDGIHLSVGCMWHAVPGPHDYAYCCDVMEHVPTEMVGLSVERILQAAPRSFFSVSFTEDGFGHTIGQTLHLTVRPFAWWRDVFNELGHVVEARDLMGEGVFYVGR